MLNRLASSARLNKQIFDILEVRKVWHCKTSRDIEAKYQSLGFIPFTYGSLPSHVTKIKHARTEVK